MNDVLWVFFHNISRRCLLRFIPSVTFMLLLCMDGMFGKLERKSNCWFYSWLNECNTILGGEDTTAAGSNVQQQQTRDKVFISLLFFCASRNQQHEIPFIVSFYCWFSCNLMAFFTIAILIFYISISTFVCATRLDLPTPSIFASRALFILQTTRFGNNIARKIDTHMYIAANTCQKAM